MTPNESFRLSGRVSVVTGAAGGLGAAIAERLAAEGSVVAALDLQVADEVAAGAGPGRIVPWECDVTDSDRVRQVVGEVVAAFGGVDVLVNNAGILTGRASLLEATPEELHRIFAVNAVGALTMVQACHSSLKASAYRGRIVNVASRTFFTGAPGQIAYVASKGALVGMTRVMAREFGPDRITVNTVMPAQVATPGTRAHSTDDVFARTMSQQAIPEFVTPEHFAGVVAFLASPDAVLITGQSMVCDGGGLLR
ncbi:SDR family NAD(P)-dependent oxidoreductase [Prescottella agglutinans]|uniref:NAD(P)-dependent dehydrogenase (Short-subunit alcohol dehydrogenase family) n=1 Tax=Prescottella agglutinans TaxID=1644129 RepID=A0ABT6M8Y4_9NOCA|nr:SDR family oxidoreductase [Prescottella agglutinans]MDH6280773.1 NAD(P)-dependent dehydrogenase (short-subunit alcohol dehydrogenase family) [Prescottella agglutinans]